MKKLTIGILLFFCFITLQAQDKITLKDGKVLTVYILEKTDTHLKYKFEKPTTAGTVFTTHISNIQSIQYENGEVDLLSSLNPRSLHPFGVSAGVSLDVSQEDGGMFVGGIDYFINPKISAELNIGTSGDNDMYFSLGGKYWLARRNAKSCFSPYAGILYGGQYGVKFWEVPVGISYISKCGFQTSLQCSYVSYNNAMVNYEAYKVSAQLRLGWRF